MILNVPSCKNMDACMHVGMKVQAYVGLRMYVRVFTCACVCIRICKCPRYMSSDLCRNMSICNQNYTMCILYIVQ